MTDVFDMTPVLEDCLEGILIIKQEKGIARLKDLAQRLNIKAPSVLENLKRLEEKNLITHEHYGTIELTDQGIIKAKEIYDRHIALKRFFVKVLLVDEKKAEKKACDIEHYLDKKTIDKIIKFINFIETFESGKFLQSFHKFMNNDNAQKDYKSSPLTGEKSLNIEKNNKVLKLSEVAVGNKVRVLKITDTGIIKTKLLSLGFIKGEIVKVEKISPLGSPVDVVVKNTHISLRKEEASEVIVEMI